jgi:hypothetical protein
MVDNSNKEYAHIFAVFIFGLSIGALSIIFTQEYDRRRMKETCAKVNNVYSCDRVISYIPKVD